MCHTTYTKTVECVTRQSHCKYDYIPPLTSVSTSIMLHFPVNEVNGTFDRLVVTDRRRQRKYRAVESRTREFVKLWNGLLLLTVRFLHFLLNCSDKIKQHNRIRSPQIKEWRPARNCGTNPRITV